MLALPGLLALLSVGRLRRRWIALLCLAGALAGIASAGARQPVITAVTVLLSYAVLSLISGLKITRVFAALLVVIAVTVGVGAYLEAENGPGIFQRQESITSVSGAEETGGKQKLIHLEALPGTSSARRSAVGSEPAGPPRGFGGSHKVEIEGRGVSAEGTLNLLVIELGAPGPVRVDWVDDQCADARRAQDPRCRGPRAAHVPGGGVRRLHGAHRERIRRTHDRDRRRRVRVVCRRNCRVLARGPGPHGRAPRELRRETPSDRRDRHSVMSEQSTATAAKAKRPGMWAQVSFAAGERRRKWWLFVATSFVSAICESATLVLVAQIAVALVKKVQRRRDQRCTYSRARLDRDADRFGLALGPCCGCVLQFPLSILPAQISAACRPRFDKTVRRLQLASWEVQSRDREGQLQETMTDQVGQATGACAGARR